MAPVEFSRSHLIEEKSKLKLSNASSQHYRVISDLQSSNFKQAS